MAFVLQGLNEGSQVRSAWKAAIVEPSRRVRSDGLRLRIYNLVKGGCVDPKKISAVFRATRHFVPGYHHLVPAGQHSVRTYPLFQLQNTPLGRIRGRGGRQPARRSLRFVGFKLRSLAKSGGRSSQLFHSDPIRLTVPKNPLSYAVCALSVPALRGGRDVLT
jgi:hypothetical protein